MSTACHVCLSLSLLRRSRMVALSNRLIEQHRIEDDRTSCHIILVAVCDILEHTIDQQTMTDCHLFDMRSSHSCQPKPDHYTIACLASYAFAVLSGGPRRHSGMQ